MFPLASAAYSDNPQDCLDNRFDDAKLIGMIHVKCQDQLNTTMCAAYVAVSPADKAIILSFRGTNNFIQLITQIGNIAFLNKHKAPLEGRVAGYFYDVHAQLWENGLNKLFKKALEEYPDYSVWVTGHSFGGAIASIAATQIMAEYKLSFSKVILVTFGQPRTGDVEFAMSYSKYIPTTFRITHKHDLVPHVPPVFFAQYKHHLNEIWYPNNMGKSDRFIVCKGEEDPKCSNSVKSPISVLDHNFYFNEAVMLFGPHGCKWSS
ncbi:unnamed protein product [Bursaphelenchus okinawaensis]|uniref:Fungal lipase-type domain-containing protein n=1 Tax=Bursaphelenchus okinawaensis TaxID=465554 RepID=A0A811L068_9BILA|nr:unnamed protein product [Bursaphelenchus okinawaensis]CAG9113822.1 unnamed protein product [Bursaphelenchus okinawaensis]